MAAAACARSTTVYVCISDGVVVKTHIINSKHLCAHCHTSRAIFAPRGQHHFRARADHDLCSRCFRAYRALLRRWRDENTLGGWLV